MEDVRTFMLLEGELCLKVLPLDWIIFSEIPGYLKDEDNENIYFTILPNLDRSECDIVHSLSIQNSGPAPAGCLQVGSAAQSSG